MPGLKAMPSFRAVFGGIESGCSWVDIWYVLIPEN
jgi:hypothetical protein